MSGFEIAPKVMRFWEIIDEMPKLRQRISKISIQNEAFLLQYADSNIKIADFGLARTALEKTEWMTAVVGTFHWMAPEVFRGEMYTNKADVYSYGIVLYELFSRQIPYLNIANPMQIMNAVTEQNQRPDLSFECQQEIKALMAKCWHPNPDQRPTFEQIINSLQSL